MQHPVIFLKGIPYWILKCLIDFMYLGEIYIEQTKLKELLEVAEYLQVFNFLIAYKRHLVFSF